MSTPQDARADGSPWPARAGTMALWTVAAALAGPHAPLDAPLVVLLALSGTAAAWGAKRLWWERTRPRSNAFWWIAGTAWVLAALLVPTPWPVVFWSIAVSLAWLHDMPASPTAMLVSIALLALVHDPAAWRGAGDAEAAWLVVALLSGVVAAVLERERLAWRSGQGASAAWNTVRVLVLAGWSLAFLLLRRPLQSVSLFRLVGIDAATTGGRVVLVGLLLVCLVLVGLLLRQRPPRPAPEAVWSR